MKSRALRTWITSCGVGSQSWGSTPGGTSETTSARSPATFAVKSHSVKKLATASGRAVRRRGRGGPLAPQRGEPAHGQDEDDACDHGAAAGRRRRPLTAPKASRQTPKAHTTVAPVGRSRTAEASMASTLTAVPKAQPTRSRVREAPAHEDAGERGDDQIGEDEEHAGDPHRAGDHHAEGRVEEKVPPADAQALAEGLGGIGRDQQERPPALPVEETDERHRAPPP